MGNIVVGLVDPYQTEAVGHGTEEESKKVKEWVTKPQKLSNAWYSARTRFFGLIHPNKRE